MKSFVLVLLIVSSTIFGLMSCSESASVNSDEQDIELAMQIFVQSLESGTVDSLTISTKVKQYIQSKDSRFFGSTVCLLNADKHAVYSPYWYKGANALLFKDLASDPAYEINIQQWLLKPLQTGSGVWSAPYFDAGGGEIWMKTYSVPVRKDGAIIAIATTDLQVSAP